MKYVLALCLLGLLAIHIAAEQHETLELDKPYQRQLTQETMYTGRFTFNIPEEKVKQVGEDKWFFFVQVQPNEQNQWVGTSIEISVGKKDSQQSKIPRKCANKRGGVDSCFFTNKQFDYKTQSIHAIVRCLGICKFKISGEISAPYKLQPAETIEMNFQNTAYSKIFTLDTSKNHNFDQLRITLTPKGFLQFPAPIGLYVNKGTTVPTRKEHDYESITLWDNGEGVFIDSPDAQNVFTILVQGPQKNILQLTTQMIVFKESVEIPSVLPYFDYLGEGQSRYYKAKVDPQKGVCIKLATFSGSIKLAGIYDNKKSPISDEFPEIYRSFSQMQYQIPAQFFKKNKNSYEISQYILFKVNGVKQSTFLVEGYELNRGITHLVPQVNRYVDLASKQLNQYYIQIVEVITEDFKKSQIELVIMHEEKKPLKARFFKCKRQHGKQCDILSSLLKKQGVQTDAFTQISSSTESHFGEGTSIYKFTFYNKNFDKVSNNSDVKRYLMTVVIQNQYEQSQGYTIRYTDISRNIYLKQKESHKDRVSIGQVKHYVYTNRNSDVNEVRIHLVEIAGRVHIEGFTADPRKEDLQGQQITDFRNTLRFTNMKMNQTIFIRVTGKEAAYYSLQVQSIKEGERQWWNRTHANRSKGFNQIVIFEDIPYEFSLQPNEKAVYQIHTKKEKFIIDMTSLLPLQLCMTQQLTKPPFQPNCEATDQLVKRETIQVRMDRGKIANIGVTNNNNKTNKFSIKFSSIEQDKIPVPDDKKNPDDYAVAKCLHTLLGKTTRQNVQKKTQTCYTYFIPRAEAIQLTVDIESRQYKKVNIFVAIGRQRIQIQNALFILKKDKILKDCNSTFPCTMKVFIQSEVKTQLRFSVQYLDGTIFLLDGIANTFSGSAQQQKRFFAYQVYNKINTTIILQNKNSSYKFYGNIIEATQYWKNIQRQKELFPSPLKNNFKSTNPFYYSHQISILTEKQIRDAKCEQCLLLITVEQEKDANSGNFGDFTIQCTQEVRFLKENSQVVTFLGKNSVAFYQLFNQRPGTLIVSLNSQNQECARLYIKKGYTRATKDSNQLNTTTLSTSILQKTERGNYALTVQATQDCYYSIEYSTTQSKIYTTIQQGYLTDVRLQKSQSSQIIYRHKTKQSFKILTLHQAGQVFIFVKSFKDIKDFLSDKNTKPKFQWIGKDFLRIENDSKFCTECYYLIELKAQRQTKTSIIIPSQGSEFPIMVDSVMKDELIEGQYESIRVYTEKIVQFQINVQHGVVNVSLLSQSQDNNTWSKIYEADQATQYESININNNKTNKTGSDYVFAQFTKIIIKAEKNSSFSFGLISDKDASKRGSRVKYGVPEYVFIEKGKRQCLLGKIDTAQEQFLISIAGNQSQAIMKNLQISCETKDKQLLQLNPEVAKYEMIVKIQKSPKKLPVDYQFCMKSKENVFVTFIQSASLVYLPENTTMVVQKLMNFSFYSQGRNILQINECRSRAVTTILTSFTTADKANSEIKQVRKSNNIIEFLYYGPVYVQVSAESGSISWRRKDQIKKIGYGYDEYSANKLRYSIVGNLLKVVIYGVKKNGNIANPMVNLGDSNYTAFLAQEEMNLYEAINCANGTYMSQFSKATTPHGQVTVEFSLSKVIQKFKGKRYILVGALVVAASKTEGDGRYRYLYPYQQIPMSAITGQKFEQPQDKQGQAKQDPIPQTKVVEEKQSWHILLYLLIAVAITAAGLLIYRRFLKKCLKRRRLQKLSEQGTGEVKYQEFSSYTNQR